MNRAFGAHGASFPANGFTLVEFIVVIAILGLMAGITSLAFVGLHAPREAAATQALRRARSDAIRTGRPVAIEADQSQRATPVLFLPDGRAIGARVDPLTGAPRDSSR